MKRPWPWLAVALAAGALAGCGGHAPEGQIVATVDGDDITTHDIERLAGQLPPGTVPDKALRGRMVATAVDTRLAVREARAEGLAKTPEYLDAARAADDAILSGMLARHVVQGLQPATPEEVDRYLAQHAGQFSGRQMIRLDQLRFARSEAGLAAIAHVNTLEQAQTALDAAHMPFQRNVAQIDSLALSPALLAQIDRLAPGKLLGEQPGGIVVLSLVLSRTPVPLTNAQARQAATAAIGRDAAQNALSALGQRLRRTARIRYQKGYAPA